MAGGAAGATAGGAGVVPEVQAIYDLLNDAGGYGALVHNMYSWLVHDVVDWSLEHDNVIPWVYEGEIGPVNDCHSDEKPFCSAWALLHRSVLPIVYDYPAMSGMSNGQHQVGLLVGAQALAETKDTTMYVVDGDSWNRYVGGIDKDDKWLKQDVSDAGHDAEDSAVTYRCWADDPATSCGQDAETCKWPYCYEDGQGGFYCGAHVGENGERWTAMFMNNGMSKDDAMLRQCPWEGLQGAQTRQAFIGAMNGFYDAALSLQASGQLAGLPDGGMYMDSEVDVDIGTGGESLGWFEDMIQAVVVQDNRCEQQIPGRAECSDSTWYPQGDEEDQVWDSFLAACRLSDLLSRKQGRNVPVIAGRLLSNAVVVPEAWESFRNSGDSFANKQWLEDFTWYCCSDDITMGDAPWHYSCL